MATPTKAELEEMLVLEKQKLAEQERVTAEQLEAIENLEQQLALSAEELEQLKSVQGVIKCIIELSPEGKKLLAKEARTTRKGIEAFQAVNFGRGRENIVSNK